MEEIGQLRATWSDSADYATKNLERLRALFRFCMHDDWIAKNPVRAVKAPKVTDRPTPPVTKPQMQRVLVVCDADAGDQDRLRAFVLAMRYSGPRIDEAAVTFRRVYYAPGTRNERGRDTHVAQLHFALRDRVANAFVGVNPLGLQVAYVRVDQAFEERAR